jgi:hypothetical protein
MAKPLGEKSRIIRTAIKAHLETGNTELAEIINAAAARKEDGITVTAQDINQQKQALKKLSETASVTATTAPPTSEQPAPKKRGRKPGIKSKPKTVPSSEPAPRPRAATPADLVDRVFLLARQCGGMGELKRLVDRLEQG